MNELRARVPESTIKALTRRTSRLIDVVERATSSSPHKKIREGGAQLIDLLGERLEEIRELHAMEDDDLPERLRSFALRIELAEQKVLSWPQAKVAPRRNGKAAPENRQRRSHRIKSAA